MQLETQDLAIYGAGGLGREVAAMIAGDNNAYHRWNLIGFFDDGIAAGTEVSHFGKVLGGIEALNAYSGSIAVVLAFGSPKITRVVRSKITNPGVWYPNIIDSDFIVSDPQTFSIGEGNIIKGGCFMSTDTRLGNFNLLNGDVVFGHDAISGDYNVFMPGVRISGEVSIGSGCLFGAMSFVHQQLRIADGVTLGPLSPLLTKPKANSTYIGNPAKIVKY